LNSKDPTVNLIFKDLYYYILKFG